MSDMREFIEGLPKAELHLHIEGTLEPELKFALAERNGVSLPAATVDEMRAAYDFDDLPSFLAVYYEGMSVLLTEQDFYDLTYAYLEKARSQNVLYAEIFFDPQAHTTRGVRFQTVISGIRRAQEEARSALGIDTQLIMCFLRDKSADSAAHTLADAADFRDWIVGVGLDSDEHGNPPVKFREVFADARDMGYRLTMHCDVDQENSLGHIRQCLDEIGVDRIDHGVNAAGEAELVAELVRRNMALTVCPISNRYVTDGTKAAEIKHLLDRGVCVTVNSDDPAYFPGYMVENLMVLQEEAGLSREELVRLSRNAFEAAWLDDARKADFLASVDAFAAANQA